jgi:hypothetical protein
MRFGIWKVGSLNKALLLQCWKRINLQVVLKFRPNWFKQEVKQHGARSSNSLILFGKRKSCPINGRSLSLLLYQFTRRMIKLNAVIILGNRGYELHTKLFPTSFSQDEVHIQMKLLRIISVGFDVTDQLLIRSFAFVKYWIKWEYNETVHQLFVDFKKTYDSVRREVLYNIMREVGVPMKLVRLINIHFV